MKWNIALVLASGLLLPATATAQDTGDPGAGRLVAEEVCSECHAVYVEEMDSPDPDAPPFAEVVNTLNMTALALRVWLQSSHPTMPNIILSPDDTANVIEYILSLKDD